MIWESWYWKKPLQDMAKRFRKLKMVEHLTEQQMVQIERDIFIGFYSIRKLIEAKTKITDKTRLSKINLTWYPNKNFVNLINNYKIHKLYNFGVKSQETRDIEFICHKIIHSYIFAPFISDDGKLSGILFASDRDKNKKIYHMDIDDVINLFDMVGKDDITEMHIVIDPQTGEETIIIN